jgi:hypothetical protein
MKYRPAHTAAETKEFSELKNILNTRGFFISEETQRWNYLFDKLAKKVLPELMQISEVGRLEISN